MATRPRSSAGREFIPQSPNLNGAKQAFQRTVKYASTPNPNRPMSLPSDNGPQMASPMRPEKYDVVSGPQPMRTTNAFHGPAAVPQQGLNLGFNK
jgi:hypothetical protein